ncbi:unnamed protein product [Vitrella brassicaformis CCMP3155]|uniref:Major facilitator superfamily (MFS) profile domain-containing protein n=1 Tax=Vitrella brassicaformis (strain CCMP3155) TaxID=1169540 RepID=A0A0G4H0P9_VITBC|nr:unnamed protein product [Vitrella brassicaformis CCMP3155]|eukprot:CEM37147.1 unnamed protein product [Vitrella brassicaformis CCMP3155]
MFFPTAVASIARCPRELWLIFLLQYLESYAYFVFSHTLIPFLTEEIGFEEAGLAYGIFGMLVSVYGFVIGIIIDNLGVKWSLVGGTAILFCSRLMLTFITDVHLLTLILFTALPVGSAMGIPVMQIGIRRYTDEGNRSLGYSILYVMMSLAAICAAPTVDAIHEAFPTGVAIAFGAHTYRISSSRLLIFAGAVMTLVSLGVSLVCMREVSTSPQGLVCRDTGREKATRDTNTEQKGLFGAFKDVLNQPSFWRFFLLVVLLLGVRMIYGHLDATFPKYMVREFGKDVMSGSIIAIKPLCVAIVVPLLALVNMRLHPLKMIIVGVSLSALSPFLLAMGHTYTTAIGFVTLLSLGEAIWYPRFYEYTVAVAAKGREGTYMALASTPMFMGTLVTGAMSGWLLDTFCPETGSRHSEMVWFIVGCVSITLPLGMMLLYGIIKDKAHRVRSASSVQITLTADEREKELQRLEGVLKSSNSVPRLSAYATLPSTVTATDLSTSITIVPAVMLAIACGGAAAVACVLVPLPPAVLLVLMGLCVWLPSTTHSTPRTRSQHHHDSTATVTTPTPTPRTTTTATGPIKPPPSRIPRARRDRGPPSYLALAHRAIRSCTAPLTRLPYRRLEFAVGELQLIAAFKQHKERVEREAEREAEKARQEAKKASMAALEESLRSMLVFEQQQQQDEMARRASEAAFEESIPSMVTVGQQQGLLPTPPPSHPHERAARRRETRRRIETIIPRHEEEKALEERRLEDIRRREEERLKREAALSERESAIRERLRVVEARLWWVVPREQWHRQTNLPPVAPVSDTTEDYDHHRLRNLPREVPIASPIYYARHRTTDTRAPQHQQPEAAQETDGDLLTIPDDLLPIHDPEEEQQDDEEEQELLTENRASCGMRVRYDDHNRPSVRKAAEEAAEKAEAEAEAEAARRREATSRRRVVPPSRWVKVTPPTIRRTPTGTPMFVRGRQAAAAARLATPGPGFARRR